VLTEKQKAVNDDTWRHIHRVRQILNACIVEILARSEAHDQSKLESPEVELFAEYSEKLAATTYGSPEYNSNKIAMKPALEHHYANNRHHPEHFEHGIEDMTLIDLLEMLCDWKASSERHTDGNIRKSIKVNADRFGISPLLAKIFENTIVQMPEVFEK